MDINYLDKISKEISQYDDESLISSHYWDIIFNNIYLTHELLKKGKFKKFSEINPKFFNEEIICQDLLEYDNPPYHYIPRKILHSPSFWINLLEKNAIFVSKIPEKILKNNEKFCFWIIEKFSDIAILEHFPESVKSNFDLSYFAVHTNVDNFKYLPKDLKNNSYLYEIIFNKETCKTSDYFKLAGDNIKSNYKFLKKAIIENSSIYSFLSPSLKNDAPLFFEMLNYAPNILKYAGNNIKSNEFCVSDSIDKNPLSIEFADIYFKSSPDFIVSVYHSIKKSNDFVEFAKLLDKSIFNDKDVVNTYFNLISEKSNYYILGKDIINDFHLMKKFICVDILAFNYIGENLKNNVDFIKECYEFHNKLNPLEQFNVDSNQSSIFKKISNEQYDNIEFLQKIYINFKPIFKDVILPILKQKKTIFAENFSNDSNFEKALRHMLDKFELKNKLENEWHTVDTKEHKKQNKI